jgi:hypothetical protein
MKEFRFITMIRCIALTLCLSVLPSIADPVITVVPDEGVSWKSIFDAGFRPKHQPGLERRNTLWSGPRFGARVGADGEVFSVGPGRLMIEVQTDASVRMIWHQSSERITFDEGQARADAFRKAFEPYIIQELTMPARMGPGGLVDAGENQHNVKARIGEWLVWYGFDSSFEGERPLVPHFYIAHSSPNRKKVRVATMEDRVQPPPGYEWYSMDPEVDTPDPGTDVSDEDEEEFSSVVAQKPRPIRREVSSVADEVPDQSRGWSVVLVLAVGLLLVALGVLVRRKLRQ